MNNNDELKPQNFAYSKHVKPRCIRERSRLLELFQILYHKEISEWCFIVKEAEGRIIQLTTVLKPSNEIQVNTDIEEAIEGINNLNTIMVDDRLSTIDEQTNIIEPVLNSLDIEPAIESDTTDEVLNEQTIQHSNLSLIDIIKMRKAKMVELDIATHLQECKENEAMLWRILMYCV